MKLLFLFLISASTLATVVDRRVQYIPYNNQASDRTDFFRADSESSEEIELDQLAINIEMENFSHQLDLTFTAHFGSFGKETRFPITGKNTFIPACRKNPGKKFYMSILLQTPHLQIENQHHEVYEILTRIQCGEKKTLHFTEQSFGHKTLMLTHYANEVFLRMKNANLLQYWSKVVRMEFPGQGAFYDYRKVHIHKPHEWDVIGHEIGHAIYHMNKVGKLGGGSHWIDRCHGKTLALSEGWASFFSAWAFLDIDATNPEFPFMVPRRAPLALEQIPVDVCFGPANEWRVIGYFWDLIDLNNDGESSEITIANLWNFMWGRNFWDVERFHRDLEQQSSRYPHLDSVWQQNFNPLITNF